MCHHVGVDPGEQCAAAGIDVDMAMVVAQIVARLSVLGGMSGAAAARTAGLDRKTVRMVLAKR